MKEKSLQKSSALAVKDKFCFINDRMRSVFEKIIVIGLLLANAQILFDVLLEIGTILDDRTDTQGIFRYHLTYNSYTEILLYGCGFLFVLLSAYNGLRMIKRQNRKGYVLMGLPVVIGIFVYWQYYWIPMQNYVH